MAEFHDCAAELGFTEIAGIPISAITGDNVTFRSDKMPWHHGPDLLGYLETSEIGSEPEARPLRMPVQWVNRPGPDFRGFAGLVSDGSVKVGQRVRVLPSGEETSIDRIVTYDGDLDEAIAGQCVTLTFADEVDASRGCVIVAPGAPGLLTSRVEARLFWMAHEPLLHANRCTDGIQPSPVCVPESVCSEIADLGYRRRPLQLAPESRI